MTGEVEASNAQKRWQLKAILPCTLHPAPCTLHPAPCTLIPNPNPEAPPRARLQVIKALREREIPIVIDADGLFIVTRNLELVRGNPRCVLTPNKAEFARLAAALDVDLESGARRALRASSVTAVSAALDADNDTAAPSLPEPCLRLSCPGSCAGAAAGSPAWAAGGSAQRCRPPRKKKSSIPTRALAVHLVMCKANPFIGVCPMCAQAVCICATLTLL